MFKKKKYSFNDKLCKIICDNEAVEGNKWLKYKLFMT